MEQNGSSSSLAAQATAQAATRQEPGAPPSQLKVTAVVVFYLVAAIVVSHMRRRRLHAHRIKSRVVHEATRNRRPTVLPLWRAYDTAVTRNMSYTSSIRPLAFTNKRFAELKLTFPLSRVRAACRWSWSTRSVQRAVHALLCLDY